MNEKKNYFFIIIKYDKRLKIRHIFTGLQFIIVTALLCGLHNRIEKNKFKRKKVILPTQIDGDF